uniref:Putative lipocalin-3 1 n=1 Tax=Rhipicephalus microplus TaxID=6941 RepID=A0A6M2D115_RHIMP
MAGHCSATMLILAVFFAIVGGVPYRGGRSVNHNYNFRKLFKSRENIWTYFSSWNDTFTCKREIMTRKRGGFIQLQISYTKNNKTHKYIANGTLSNVWGHSHPLNLMYIKDDTNDRLNKELLFATENYSCAVLYVESFNGPQPVTFDLVVKESHLKNGPSGNCIKNYKEQIEIHRFLQVNRTVYEPACQRF